MWRDVFGLGRELGMDADEILRLSQISGLAEMFADRQFSEAWEAESIMDKEITSEDLEELEDNKIDGLA